MAQLKAETKCSICLDDLVDPVTIQCGHNFCRACIWQSWANLKDKFPCPVCRFECEKYYYWSNKQLGSMVQIVSKLHSSHSKRQRPGKTNLCEKHNQELTLFCEKDLEVLCPQCLWLPNHSGHRLSPLREAAMRHRARLHNYAKVLRRKAVDTQKLIRMQRRVPLELREKAEALRQKLACEVELLSQFLACKQQAALEQLAEEEQQIRRKLSDNISAFASYGASLKSLLARVVEHSTLSKVELLSQIKHFYQGSDCEINQPIFSIDLQREAYSFPPQYSALQKIKKKFHMDIIIDPETAYPNLFISADLKCVGFAKKKASHLHVSRSSTANFVVLGYPNFYTGRYFWQVKVGDVPQWAVGVCRASLSSKNQWSGQGCWCVQLQDGGYNAPGAEPAVIQLDVRDRTLGVFLDYELGEVLFYDMPEGAHICTFSTSFNEPLLPYFYIGPNSRPLRIVRE
ncbi:tripartite motif-containing protein 75-like [Cavia porcellus]|uniref:tripartite motif-containing protein 75-like n=1 Tax=Cavia porcellus TaxID=10141 RepID=UPI002FE34ABE